MKTWIVSTQAGGSYEVKAVDISIENHFVVFYGGDPFIIVAVFHAPSSVVLKS